MPDPTDAYCEQCGNRYAFLSSPRGPKGRRRVRIVARGLKDFIQHDWRSLDAAITLARDDEAHREFARATEAFQQAFNFCFTCRRSVCADCWSESDGVCRGCAPVPEPVAQTVPKLAPRPAQELGRLPAEPVVLQPQPDGVQTQILRPSLARLIANVGSHRERDRSPSGDLIEGGPSVVGWPRPTQWLERPIPVRGREAGAKASTLPATPNETESAPDGSAGEGAAEASPRLAGTTFRRDPVPVMADPGWDDGVCHNCGLPTPPRGRFCRRCGLLIARWSEGESAVEELAVGQE